MQLCGYDIGVCSWSLAPNGSADLMGRMKELGLDHLHLGLWSLLELSPEACAAELKTLRDSAMKITATSIGFVGEDYSTLSTIRRTGGFVRTETWPARREVTLRAAQITRELGATMLECHIGFLPPSSGDDYPILVERVREVATDFQTQNVELLIETGQASASELLQFLNDLNCRNIGVNYDPGNMILYGAGDPISGIAVLGRHIRHVHLKDAIHSEQPGLQWGKETAWGSGAVGAIDMLDALDAINYTGPLMLERDAGRAGIADLRAGIASLRGLEVEADEA
jgi:sugar phosphate isomerase/epimerase